MIHNILFNHYFYVQLNLLHNIIHTRNFKIIKPKNNIVTMQYDFINLLNYDIYYSTSTYSDYLGSLVQHKEFHVNEIINEFNQFSINNEIINNAKLKIKNFCDYINQFIHINSLNKRR